MSIQDIETELNQLKDHVNGWAKKIGSQKIIKIIEKNKHYYEEDENNLGENSMVFKTLSNSLSRVCNPLYFKNPKRYKGYIGPGCTAINLDYSKNLNHDKKFILNKIYFSSKRETDNSQKRIQDIIAYCFNEETKNFIDSNIKQRIKDILIEHDENFVADIATNEQISDSDFLELLGNYFYQHEITLGKAFGNIDKEKTRQKLHYCLLIVFDLLVLRDIFERHFTKHENFTIQPFMHEDINYKGVVHPDSLLASALMHTEKTEKLKNRYIGTTFLCCIYCSIFLDCHSFEFSGTSEEFETSWKIPPECKDNQEFCQNFMAGITALKDKILNEKIQGYQPTFETTFKYAHPIHECRRTAGKISDDTSIYMMYYDKYPNII